MTHWSSRLLADELEIGNATVARVWREWELQPWRTETFKFSTDPLLEAKVRDIVGQYLTRRRTRLCCAWTRSRRSRRWTAPRRCCRSCLGCRRRRPTTTSGTAPPPCSPPWRWPLARSPTRVLPRHWHQEFLKFLKQVAKAYPGRKLHIVLDNYGTHKHPTVTKWLTRNKRITLHFTPTSGSWMNMVEIFFGITTRQAIRRGTFTSVDELIDAIRDFIHAWNERCEPFVWTKPADQILKKAQRKETSETGH